MKTNGEILTGLMDKAVADGEIPYQSNRAAVVAFDIREDPKDGQIELMSMFEGIDVFLSDLEQIRDGLAVVARKARSYVR
jgi:hypothetical protein